MKYLNRYDDLIIDNASPWKDDIFKLKKHGETLATLVESLTKSYVISVRSGWGTGKSVFLKRLAAELEKRGTPTVIVDAWRTDYLGDPLIAFVTQLESRISDFAVTSKSAAEKKNAEKVKKNLRSVSVSTAEIIFFAAGTAADAKFLGSGFVLKRIGRSISAWLKKNGKSISPEIEFGNALRNTRDILTSRDVSRPIQRQIVFIVDELDRCRPDYAVKALERIKHFFSVQGVVFILATDRHNLPNAIRSVYGGNSEDADRYLRKFIDYEYELPQPEAGAFSVVLSSEYGMDDLIQGIDIDKHRSLYDGVYEMWDGYRQYYNANRRAVNALEAAEYFPKLARYWKLPLREQSQAYNVMSAILRTMPDTTVCFPQVLVYLCCLRFAAPEFYANFRENRRRLTSVVAQSIELPVRSVDHHSQEGADIFVFSNIDAQEDYRMSTVTARAADNTLDGYLPHAWRRLQVRVENKPVIVFDFVHEALSLSFAFAPDVTSLQ